MFKVDDDYNTYKGYLLNDDKNSWDLSDEDKADLDMGIAIIEYHYSIRNIEKEGYLGRTKSTIHRHIHKNIRELSSELYSLVCKQLRINSIRSRGGFKA